MIRLFLLSIFILSYSGDANAAVQCKGTIWNDCHGIKVLSNGDKYVGSFKDNKYNGKGTYTSASGEVYIGSFKRGQRHGYGTYSYNDGSVYSYLCRAVFHQQSLLHKQSHHYMNMYHNHGVALF